MKTRRWIISLVSLAALSATAQFSQPYQWSHSVQGRQLIVEVEIPETAYLYAEQTKVKLEPDIPAAETPGAHPHTDDIGTSDVYEGGQTHRWVYPIDPAQSVQVSISYQGCGTPEGGGGAVCYPPANKTFSVGTLAGEASLIRERVVDTGSLVTEKPVLQDREMPQSTETLEAKSLSALLDRFETVRTTGGMKNAEEFLAFLDIEQEVKSSASILEGKSSLVMILFVLLGGLMLNLTPCVLPMIPVNLAIIGAGAEAASKRQGFLRGGVYGLGMAVAYGGLGLFTVLTGSKFGTLNASPIFNFSIAAIFILLSLAMFDVLRIDLSRFGTKFGFSTEKRGRLIPAFAMGVVAALLAGACVAPILIAVLLQATTLYAGGNVAGLFLPLLLGVGMALPWPIAGAGLTVLPKPGNWMVKIKHGFGVLIILFAAYYAWVGIGLLPKGAQSTEVAIAQLETELMTAAEEGRPVFIDFWASWCKNCLQMEKTTFKDPGVMKRLHEFTEIKFQAEKLADPQIKALLDRYNLPGLPGYVILTPKN